MRIPKGVLTMAEFSPELNDDIKELIYSVDNGVYPVDVKVKGRTLINLLGRIGNPIYKQIDSLHLSNVDSSTLCSGDVYILNGTNTSPCGISTYGKTEINSKFTIGKYYIALCDAMLVTGDSAVLSFYSDNQKGANSIKEKNVWKQLSVVGVARSSTYIEVSASGSMEGKKAMFKNIRVYEIDKSVYDKIGVEPEYEYDKLAEKYPYVDDVKCVVNPYFECNENLLEDIKIAQGGTLVNGDIEIPVLTSVFAVGTMKVPVKPNTDYYIDSSPVSPINFTCYMQGINFENKYNSFNSGNNSFFNLVIDCRTVDNVSKVVNLINSGKYSPVLVEGTTPIPYNQCHNSRMMFETKLYDGETIQRDNSGQYFKNSEWEEYILNPNKYLPSDTGGRGTDTHGVTFLDIELSKNSAIDPSVNQNDFALIRYDGKIIESHVGSSGWMNKEAFHFGGSPKNTLYLSIPNSITGWGPSYNPTQDEIRAFFLGWRMYCDKGSGVYTLYDGSGVKAWSKIWCGIGSRAGQDAGALDGCIISTGTTTLPMSLNDQGYTPYRLIYKKETPTKEIVKTHGSLVAKQGVDVFASSGLVLGEKFNPVYNGSNWFVNGSMAEQQTTRGTYKIQNAINVYNIEKNINFQNIGQLTGITNGACWIKLLDKGYKDVFVDYQIYNYDNVLSFDFTCTLYNNTKEVLTRLVEELSNTNKKISDNDLHLNQKLELISANPNMLINGDFRVWQRGVSFQKPSAYIADRWKAHTNQSSSDIIVSKSPNGLKVTNADSEDTLTLAQVVDGLTALYEDKIYTLSIKFKDSVNENLRVRAGTGGVHSWNWTRTFLNEPFVILEDGLVYTTFYVQNLSNEQLSIELSGIGFNTTMEWVKLELGDKPTPHVPRPYAEELAMCQRYYEKRQQHLYPLNRLNSIQSCTGIIYNVEKRISPTPILSYNGTKNIISICNSEGIMNDSVALGGYVLSNSNNGFNIVTGAINTTRAFFAFEADAEIY